MADQDSSKKGLQPAGVGEAADSHELHEDDLQAVTGGLGGGTGSSLSTDDTAVCVSTD